MIGECFLYKYRWGSERDIEEDRGGEREGEEYSVPEMYSFPIVIKTQYN